MLPDALRPVQSFVFSLTEPLLRIFRPLIPPLRVGAVALDLSVLLVFILFGFVQTAVCAGGL